MRTVAFPLLFLALLHSASAQTTKTSTIYGFTNNPYVAVASHFADSTTLGVSCNGGVSNYYSPAHNLTQFRVSCQVETKTCVGSSGPYLCFVNAAVIVPFSFNTVDGTKVTVNAFDWQATKYRNLWYDSSESTPAASITVVAK
jgi:hypothetical protein